MPAYGILGKPDIIKWIRNRKQMNQPQTPDNEVARPCPPPMPRTEAVVNKSIEEDDGAYLTEDLHIHSRQLERELTEKTNEVSRLRELLNRAIEIADEFWKNQKQAVTIWHGELADELEEIKAEARLAPAPEEPVTEK